ncbi:hypothetical protein LIER_35672 [Lithospermum erythrorhizon]|uniref:Uncharacterized protein n=1 Tax=Lithospermum erythrorhizon TaxID=34254 RepID=A0AAV3NX85_LITER
MWRRDMPMQQESPTNNNTTSTCSIVSEKFPPELDKVGSECTHLYPSNNNNITIEGNSSVKCIVVMGDKLFSAHQDHKVRVFRIHDSTPNENLKCISTLPTINDRWIKPFWGKNYVKEGKNKKHTWVHHVDTVSSLVISKDGCLLYSASWDRTFKIWRVSDFKCMESVQDAHDDAINAIVVSFDGYVYTGSGDRKIKVWKILEGEKRHALVATLEKHKSGVNALALSDDGLVLYSGACDRSILVWEKEGGGGGCPSSRKDRFLRVTHPSTTGDTTSSRGGHMVVVGALRGHNKAILCLVVVGDLVVSGSADATVRIWRRGEGRSYGCLGVLEGHAKPVKSLALVVDSCYEERDGFGGGSYYLVYSGSLDCDIKVWRIWIASQ